MAEKTAIEWCDSTWNPWIGCTRVSPACDDCYAARSTPARTLGVAWGAGQPRRRTSADNWGKPVAWNKAAAEFFAQHGRRRRVFCASLADIFDNEVAGEWRADLFRLILATPDLDWLLLTKRVGNVRSMMATVRLALADVDDWREPMPPNVWLGITIVNQSEADRDILKLAQVPVRVRFLSIEPMLGEVDVMKWLQPYTCADCQHHGSVNDCGPDGCEKCGEDAAFDGRDTCKACGADDQSARASCPRCGSHRSYEEDSGFIWSSEQRLIDWVICGGESGPQARPMHPDWARGLRDQCESVGVPFLFKQHGEWLPTTFCDEEAAMLPVKRTVYIYPDGHYVPLGESINFFAGVEETAWVGKKAAGRLLDGRTHDEFPTA